MSKYRRRKSLRNPKDNAEMLFAPIEWVAGLIDKAFEWLWRKVRGGKAR